MTTLKPRQRSTHVLEHAQTHHGIPLHTKDARNSTSDSARNSGCATDRSPIKRHHLERYTGLEWHETRELLAQEQEHIGGRRQTGILTNTR